MHNNIKSAKKQHHVTYRPTHLTYSTGCG